MAIEQLTAAGESRVEVHHFGAHVTSWKNAKGEEMIYTSPTAIYDGTKAIRGGIPICFPQFAKRGALRQHGFARNMTWALDGSYASGDSSVAKRFVLSDTEDTRSSEWPYRFEVGYIVRLSADGNRLSLEMTVRNCDDRSFGFTTALHSYFTCASEATTLREYDGLSYEDNADADSGVVKTQRGEVRFGKEVDRVYLRTADTLSLPGLRVEKTNLPDAVVWNPHIDKAAALKDMPDDDWRRFVCIEPARVATAARVAPTQSWAASLVLTSVP